MIIFFILKNKFITDYQLVTNKLFEKYRTIGSSYSILKRFTEKFSEQDL